MEDVEEARAAGRLTVADVARALREYDYVKSVDKFIVDILRLGWSEGRELRVFTWRYQQVVLGARSWREVVNGLTELVAAMLASAKALPRGLHVVLRPDPGDVKKPLPPYGRKEVFFSADIVDSENRLVYSMRGGVSFDVVDGGRAVVKDLTLVTPVHCFVGYLNGIGIEGSVEEFTAALRS